MRYKIKLFDKRFLLVKKVKMSLFEHLHNSEIEKFIFSPLTKFEYDWSRKDKSDLNFDFQNTSNPNIISQVTNFLIGFLT